MNAAVLASENVNWKQLYIIGAVATLVQLVAILAYTIAMATLGPKPASIEEYFAIQQVNLLASVLRGDFLFLFLIGGYLGTFPALYVALRNVSPVYAMFATLFTLIAVTICLSANPPLPCCIWAPNMPQRPAMGSAPSCWQLGEQSCHGHVEQLRRAFMCPGSFCKGAGLSSHWSCCAAKTSAK